MENTDFIKYIADIVKQHRKKSGLSQIELAEMAGVGKTTVFDIEHAKPTVHFVNILNILRVLNVDLCLKSPLLKDSEIKECE